MTSWFTHYGSTSANFNLMAAIGADSLRSNSYIPYSRGDPSM